MEWGVESRAQARARPPARYSKIHRVGQDKENSAVLVLFSNFEAFRGHCFFNEAFANVEERSRLNYEKTSNFPLHPLPFPRPRRAQWLRRGQSRLALRLTGFLKQHGDKHRHFF